MQESGDWTELRDASAWSERRTTGAQFGSCPRYPGRIENSHPLTVRPIGKTGEFSAKATPAE